MLLALICLVAAGAVRATVPTIATFQQPPAIMAAAAVSPLTITWTSSSDAAALYNFVFTVSDAQSGTVLATSARFPVGSGAQGITFPFKLPDTTASLRVNVAALGSKAADGVRWADQPKFMEFIIAVEGRTASVPSPLAPATAPVPPPIPTAAATSGVAATAPVPASTSPGETSDSATTNPKTASTAGNTTAAGNMTAAGNGPDTGNMTAAGNGPDSGTAAGNGTDTGNGTGAGAGVSPYSSPKNSAINDAGFGFFRLAVGLGAVIASFLLL